MFDLENNMLLNFAVDHSPCLIKGHYLALQGLEENMQLDQVKFHDIPFFFIFIFRLWKESTQQMGQILVRESTLKMLWVLMTTSFIMT